MRPPPDAWTEREEKIRQRLGVSFCCKSPRASAGAHSLGSFQGLTHRHPRPPHVNSQSFRISAAGRTGAEVIWSRHEVFECDHAGSARSVLLRTSRREKARHVRAQPVRLQRMMRDIHIRGSGQGYCATAPLRYLSVRVPERTDRSVSPHRFKIYYYYDEINNNK